MAYVTSPYSNLVTNGSTLTIDNVSYKGSTVTYTATYDNSYKEVTSKDVLNSIDNYIRVTNSHTYIPAMQVTNTPYGAYDSNINQTTSYRAWEITPTYQVWNENVSNLTCLHGVTFNSISLDSWAVPPDPKMAKRLKLKENLFPVIITKRNIFNFSGHPGEPKALCSLREIITETEYRKYLRYGFVNVTGKSGDTYQIFRNKSHTKVFRGGKLIEEICVRINSVDAPPTDSVIAFKTLIETNEEDFKALGNRYKMVA